MKREIWEKPRLHNEEDHGHHRKVSWLELFYDLVFVVVIAQLAHHLTEHYDLHGLFGFALSFVPIWWVWISSTIYNERFESNGVENRVITFVLLCCVAGLAVFAKDPLHETARGFGLTYAAARAFFILLWLRAGYHEPRFRAIAVRLAIGFSISVALFVASVWAYDELRWAMWGVALTIDVLTPLSTGRLQKKLPKFSSSKLPERFGLFTIIVLGETLVGVIGGIAEVEVLTLQMFSIGILGLLMGLSLWWIYFDFIGRRPCKPGVWYQLGYNYLHLPLMMSIVAVGAGISHVIAAGEWFAVPTLTERMLLGCAAVGLVVLGAIEALLHVDKNEPMHIAISPALKVGTGVLLGFTAAWAPVSNAIQLLGLILLPLFLNMMYGAWAWFRQELPDPESEIG